MGNVMARCGDALRRMQLCDILCAIGLALNLTWCSLEGHAAGFADASNGMGLVLNPRVFWLAGIAVVALLFLLMPQAFKSHDHVLRFVVPTLGSLGTLCFAFSYSQPSVDGAPLAMVGLFFSGFGHFWLSSRFVLLLVRMRPFTAIVWSAVGAILVKMVLLSLSVLVLPPVWQIGFAALIPVANALVFEGARLAAARRVVPQLSAKGSRPASASTPVAHKHTVFGLPTLPRHIVLMKGGQRSLVLLIVMSGLILATVRRFSFWGLWGGDSSFQLMAVSGLSEFLTVAVCLGVFAYLALIKTAKLSMAIRFQPAVIVVVAGLFLIAVQQPVELLFFDDVKGIVIHVDEAFAYVLFWSVMALSLDALDMPPFRVLGIGGMTFALVSLAWVVMSGHVGDIDSAFIVLAAYSIIVVSMLYTYRESKRYSKLEEAEALQALQVKMRAFEGEPTSAADEGAASLVDSITDRCAVLSEEYRLTPRESEVFCLLAQGRTRAFIQEELVLSSSTVKTHISHIYAKLAVCDRQEMMDLVLSERE